MTKVRTKDGQTVEVDPGTAQYEYQRGNIDFDGPVQLVRGNEAGEVDAADLPTALAQGWEVATPEQQSAAKTRAEQQGLAGDIRGGAEAFARGATLGLSDVAARELGADMAAMQTRRAQIGGGATLLEVAGGVAPGLATGGAGTAATVAKFTPAGAATRLGMGAAESAGLRGASGLAVQGAVEGFAQGAGDVASEDALGDRDLSAERMLAGGVNTSVMGALLGGGTGLAGKGLAATARGGKRVAQGAVERLVGMADDLDPALRAEGGLLGRAQDAQILGLGGRAQHVQAGRHLRGLAATAEGRAQMAAAGSKRAVDDLVGSRLRSSIRGTDTRGLVDDWTRSFAKEARAGQKGASEARDQLLTWTKAARNDPKLAGLTEPLSEGAEKRLRKILKSGSDDMINSPATAHRWLSNVGDDLDAFADDLTRAGSTEVAAVGKARDIVRSLADDTLSWGPKAGKARELYAAQRAEADALAKLPKKLRDFSSLDDDAFAKLARYPDAVAEVSAARSKIADVLEAQGADVAGIRRSLDDVQRALKTRGELRVTHDAIEDLKGLEQGPRGYGARKVLEGFGSLGGGAFGGLPGLFAGRLGGEVAGLATRPLAAINTLARIRQMTDAVAGREAAIIRGVERIAEGGAKAAKAASKTAVRGARTAASKTRKADSSRPHARSARTKMLDTVRRTVMQLASDPESLPEKLGEGMNEIRSVAPKLAKAMSARAGMAVAFLRSKAPDAYSPPFSDTVIVDPAALEEFGRYVDAVTDPIAAVKMIERGGLALEHAEALRAVYPSMYREIQQGVLAMVGRRAKAGKPVSHLARVQLGLLLDLPLDESQVPGPVSMAQPQAPPEQPPQQQGEIRAEAKVDHGAQLQTRAQSLEAGMDRR